MGAIRNTNFKGIEFDSFRTGVRLTLLQAGQEKDV